MPNSVSFLDGLIIVVYFLLMVGVGVYFSKRNNNSTQFTTASGRIPGWALGLSFYATFLSAITFLGDPGKSFGSNWNPFVFSLSMPFAAYISARFLYLFTANNKSSAPTVIWSRALAPGRVPMPCFVLS